MIGTRGAGITRRTAIVGGLAAPLIIPTGIRTGHAQAVNRDRIILGMTQEPVQFNPLL